MKQKKTSEIVFGAMMIAIYAILIVLDTYTGAMMNIFLYYLMPLPFIVFGLRYGLKMTAYVGLAALFLGCFFGLPETIFLSFCAIIVALCVVLGMQEHWSGGRMFLAVMIVTTLSQLLSLTLLASLFGYDLALELTEIQQMLGLHENLKEWIRIILPLTCLMIGGLEAFIMLTFCDLLLLKLGIERLPRFSLVLLHFPKWVGCMAIISFVLVLLRRNDFTWMFSICMNLLMCVQGLSFSILWLSLHQKPRILNVLCLFACFIPGLNGFFTVLGLYDIFSERRQKILYNRVKR